MPETPARSLADAPAPGVDLVLLGGDIGIYALARAFHERYRISATVVTRKVAGPVADSSILRTVELGMDATEDDMIRALEEVGADKASRPGGTRPILLANADFLVALLAAHRERLSAWFHLPLLDDDVLEAVADKATFSTLCAEIDVPTPRTVVLDFAGGAVPDVPELDLGWPLVAKASRSSAYNAVSFPASARSSRSRTAPSWWTWWRSSPPRGTATASWSRRWSRATTPRCCRSPPTSTPAAR